MREPENWDGMERREPRWHVAREIPIAVVLALALQTCTGVWFLASLSAKVDSALDTLREFRLERYTKEDAERDRQLFLQALSTLQAHDIEMQRRLDRLEAVAHPIDKHALGALAR